MSPHYTLFMLLLGLLSISGSLFRSLLGNHFFLVTFESWLSPFFFSWLRSIVIVVELQRTVERRGDKYLSIIAYHTLSSYKTSFATPMRPRPYMWAGIGEFKNLSHLWTAPSKDDEIDEACWLGSGLPFDNVGGTPLVHARYCFYSGGPLLLLFSDFVV